MVDTLTSPANPTLKALRALHEKKYRRADGRFLAEGLRIVTEALEAGIVPEVLVFAADNAGHPLVARLVAATEGSGGQAIATTPALLAKLTLKDNPQAVVGVFRARPVPLAQIDPARAPLWLVVQAIRDPGNLGTIMRTGDAVGAGGVILLDDCCDPFGVETVRASMGAVFTQSVTLTDGDGFFAWVRGRGFVAGAALAGAVDYRRAALSRPDLPSARQRAGRAARRLCRALRRAGQAADARPRRQPERRSRRRRAGLPRPGGAGGRRGRSMGKARGRR